MNVSDVPVTVVDPRPMRLDAYVRRFRAGHYHRNHAPSVRAHAHRPADAPLAAPKHLRVYLHSGLWRGDERRRAAALDASWALARKTRWSRRGLVRTDDAIDGRDGEEAEDELGGTGGGLGEAAAAAAADASYRRRGEPLRNQRAALRQEEERARVVGLASPASSAASAVSAFVSAADAAACAPESLDAPATASAFRAALRDCSAIVGLHPDQAAGAAVDLAVALGKPFAVVPCCAYAEEFRERRVPMGVPSGAGGKKKSRVVRTTEDLVEYLLARAGGRARRRTLGFGGKNVVVFSLGSEECAAPDASDDDGNLQPRMCEECPREEEGETER